MEEVIYVVDSGPQVPAAGSFLVVTKRPEKEHKSFDKEEEKWVFLLSPEPTQRHRPGWHVPGQDTCVWGDRAGLGAEGTTAGEPDTLGLCPSPGGSRGQPGGTSGPSQSQACQPVLELSSS